MDELGILAYGSLIDDPGPEIKAATKKRIDTKTPFNVEFARSSGSRGGAPTLVPVDVGGSRVHAVILVLGDITVNEAKNILYRREIHSTDLTRVYSEPVIIGINTIVVDVAENLDNVRSVLYTRIAANIDPLTTERLAELAIESARNQNIARQNQDGIHYLISALNNGIVTPLSPGYKTAILAQTKTNSLEDAFQSVQS